MKEEIVIKAAQDLFDNRLGWSNNRQPYAPRELWANLGEALYGKDDERVKELRNEAAVVSGALARAYCTKRNETKVVDRNLIEDMVKELESLRFRPY